MKKRIEFILLFFCFVNFSLAQTSNKADSLLSIANVTKNDSLKIKLLNDAVWEYMFLDKTQAFSTAEKALSLALKINKPYSLSDCYNTLGCYYMIASDFAKGTEYHEKALAIRLKLKDKKGLDSLARLLKDEFPDVRIAAAYALGQIGESRAENMLLAAFESQDTVGAFAKFNATIMEAVGKCGTAKRLKDLCDISTFKMTDTILLTGQAYGIYRYGLRDTFNYQSIQNPLPLRLPSTEGKCGRGRLLRLA